MPGFGQRLEGCRNPTLRWILYGFDKNFGKKLDEARTTWNQKIREYYRDVLSLNTKYAPIRTTYMPDDNGVFIRLIDKEYPDLDFAELVALKRYVGEAEKVLAYFSNDSAACATLLKSKEYANARLMAYDLNDIVKRLFSFYQRSPHADIFGRYYLDKHSVEIYVIPCIIFSMLIEEDFLDMVIGTLAHELAHGFHHVGADKDDAVWEGFEEVDAALVEGLAEYYTREFSRSVTGHRPSVLRTFEKTSKYLPEAYRRYEQWDGGSGLEAVYQAFIEARRNDIRTFDEFRKGLEEANTRLGPGSGMESTQLRYR